MNDNFYFNDGFPFVNTWTTSRSIGCTFMRLYITIGAHLHHLSNGGPREFDRIWLTNRMDFETNIS